MNVKQLKQFLETCDPESEVHLAVSGPIDPYDRSRRPEMMVLAGPALTMHAEPQIVMVAGTEPRLSDD